MLIAKSVFPMQNVWVEMSLKLKKAIGERVIRVQRSSIVPRKLLACNIFSAYHIEEALILNARKATQVSCATNALEKLIRFMSRQLEVNASCVLVLPFKSLLQF
jgi:hypothetical protein